MGHRPKRAGQKRAAQKRTGQGTTAQKTAGQGNEQHRKQQGEKRTEQGNSRAREEQAVVEEDRKKNPRGADSNKRHERRGHVVASALMRFSGATVYLKLEITACE